jgi:hypothetical protein
LHLESLAKDFEQAAKIIRSQIPHRNAIWMRGLQRRKFGNEVSNFVADIRQLQSTGRSRNTTWARDGDKESRRRVQNTMGYVFDTEVSREGPRQSGTGSNCTIVSVTTLQTSLTVI